MVKWQTINQLVEEYPLKANSGIFVHFVKCNPDAIEWLNNLRIRSCYCRIEW